MIYPLSWNNGKVFNIHQECHVLFFCYSAGHAIVAAFNFDFFSGQMHSENDHQIQENMPQLKDKDLLDNFLQTN